MTTSQAPEAVFRVWRNRERIENEAAQVFANLARNLYAQWGPQDPVAKLAEAAAQEELEHAEFCRAILRESPHPLPLSKPAHFDLGPQALNHQQRTLYTCVAIGCVTESMSTALLIEMQKRARPGLIKDTVQRILTDEVQHSRIGWAELSRSRETEWLTPYVSEMIHGALTSDVGPMLSKSESEEDLSEWGILSPMQAQGIMQETIEKVILPGLRKFGLRS